MKRDLTFVDARVGPVRIQEKAHEDKLCRTCVFVSGWIYGSHSAFWCDRGTKCDRTIFHDGMGLVRIQQKVHRDTLCEHVFLHPVGYVGRVVHSGASGAQNVDAFSSSGGPGAVSIKNAAGHVTHNLCFCILCDVRVS
jgi:hypothetical protein